ncbi:MAG: glycosyltransferase family 39 protein [Gemmatimonadales bacterium]
MAIRLFLTVWLVYGAHLTSNVVRETYLAVALGDRLSIRVDPFLGLHPDLFEMPGRGAYINSNPGASMLGAIPYVAARPVMEALFRLKPELVAPKPPTTYDDPRLNRSRFMNEMRARGLDVKLALAAFSMQLGLMAPLGAFAAVVMYRLLSLRLGDERRALWLALLYAFGSPLFFRSAFLNQNAILAHLVFFAWALLAWPGQAPESRGKRWLAAGGLLGLGLLCDYSAVPLCLAFGVWALWEGWRAAGFMEAVKRGAILGAGALGPVAVLFAYQYAAFGNPWFPAQRYMPETEFSTSGVTGFTSPTLDLLWRNLLDPAYGLFAFCPMLVAALLTPLLRRTRGAPPPGESLFVLGACAGLWLFNSANQFANLQWNTGVRYMVPAVPLLFVLLVPVLVALPRWGVALLVLPTLLISWAVSMLREDVLTSIERLFTRGPTLPLLIVLRKTAAAYAPFLADGGAYLGLLGVVAVGVMVWGLWTFPARVAPAG